MHTCKISRTYTRLSAMTGPQLIWNKPIQLPISSWREWSFYIHCGSTCVTYKTYSRARVRPPPRVHPSPRVRPPRHFVFSPTCSSFLNVKRSALPIDPTNCQALGPAFHSLNQLASVEVCLRSTNWPALRVAQLAGQRWVWQLLNQLVGVGEPRSFVNCTVSTNVSGSHLPGHSCPNPFSPNTLEISCLCYKYTLCIV